MGEETVRSTVVIGVDFGTLSGRALVVRAADGAELGSAVHEYRHGVVDRRLPATGAALPPEWALQVPDDYRDVLRHAVPAALANAGVSPEQVVGIATDFTASTPLPTLADGTPLCELPELEDRPHAYVKLWKHHAAQSHADRINELAAERGEPWLARYGGRISSEWEFAKALQVLEEDPEVYERAERWIEAADWIVWQLCGRETRNTCTAGFKGIYQDDAYPSADYLAALNPDFAGFVADKLDHPLSPLGARAGDLTAEAAGWTGLPEGIAVAVGNVDAHVTAPAAQAIEPGHLVAIMGTSTCHVMNGDRLAEVAGMCGVVRGGITPGRGDTRPARAPSATSSPGSSRTACPRLLRGGARSRHQRAPAPQRAGRRAGGGRARPRRPRLDGRQPLGPRRPHTLRRGIRPDPVDDRAGDLPRALEATAFGTRTIVEAFEAAGLPVERLVVAGGLLPQRSG